MLALDRIANMGKPPYQEHIGKNTYDYTKEGE